MKNAQQAAFGETSILRTTNLGATWTRLTGLGPTAPLADPGVIALYTAGAPTTRFYSWWEQPIPQPAPLVMFQVPGFISSVFRIQVPIPANRTFNGTNVRNGVQQVSFALLLFVPIGDLPQPVSNIVNVHLK